MRLDRDDLETVSADLRRLRRSSRRLVNEARYEGDRAWRLRMDSLRRRMELRESRQLPRLDNDPR